MARPGWLRRGSRGGRLLAAAALVAAVVAIVVLVTGTGSNGPASPATAAGTTGTATVERHDIVETDTEAGTLSYSDPQTVYDWLSGTLTWLPSTGAEIRPGQPLFDVDGAPVILMNGSTPAYRALSPDDSAGTDILQLNRNLIRLGFNPDGIIADDEWQAATTAGVVQFQDSLSEAATGTLALGQVVFLPGDQLVASVIGALGSTGSGGGTGSGASSASLLFGDPTPEFVSLSGPGTLSTPTTATGTTPSTTTGTGTTPSPGTGGGPSGRHRPGRRGHHRGRRRSQTLAALIALLKAELAELRAERTGATSSGGGSSGSSGSGSSGHSGSSGSSGSGSGSSGSGSGSSSSGSGSGSGSSGSGSGSSGAGGASPQAVLDTTSTHLVVTVDLSPTLQSEARVGEHVMVELPAGTFVPGRITAVSPIAQSSSSGSGSSGGGSSGGSGGGSGGSGSGSSSTIPVTISLNGHHAGAGLDQAAVSVNFVQQRANNVLRVPVTALLATSGGNYEVQEAAAPHRLLPVTVGLFAAGYVQISGPGIVPGLVVTDSQG